MRKILIITMLFSLLAVPAQARKLSFTVEHHLPLSHDVVYPGFEDGVSQIAGVSVTARSIVVIDAESGKVIYDIKPLLKTPIASITKLMSLVIFIESGANLYSVIEAKNEDLANLKKYIEEGDSIASLALYPGDKMLVKDAVYAGVVRSANDAVSMFVRASGLSEEEFVRRMNERARVLGMYDTYFTEATGLDPKNISTARDVARLAQYAFKNGFIRRITTTKNYKFETIEKGISYQSENTNDLLGMFDSTYYQVLGGKTGYLDESRYNIVTQVKNWQGKEVIVVVLGAESNEKRFWESKRLAIEAFGEM